MANEMSNKKILGIGFLTAVSVSLFVVPMFKLGISPMPAPPSLLFISKLLGFQAPLPLGLLAHVIFVMILVFIFLKLVKNVNFLKTTYLALAAWVGAVAIFFPIIGWGFMGFGLGMGPKIMIAALLPHFLFDLFLWVYSVKVFK